MPIETQNLCGGYNAKLVVRDINLSLQAGEWLSLIGANGSGKSTFLKLLCRILPPTKGVVLLDGKSISNLPAPVVAQRVAFLPQQQAIPTGMSVYQLVSLGRTPHQPWWQWELNNEDRQKVEAAIAQTQLEDYRDRTVAQLSGGERQRAFLALALAQNPQVLLLDEPTTYLDINYQLQLLELLKQLNRERQLTIITVLHDINLAARYSDRLALLKDGNLYAIGKPAEVLTPEIVATVFGVRVARIETPVGLQIYPIASV